MNKDVPLHTINGIRNSADSTTDRVGRLLEGRWGYTWHKIAVPVTHTWDAWFKGYSLRIAREHILGQVIPGSDLVAHSHGCQLAWAAMYAWNVELGNSSPLFRRVVFLGPAMNRRGWEWGRLEFESLRVIHNPWDLAIRFGSWIPGHSFGRAGAQGLETDDIRVENVAKTSFSGPFNHNAPYFRPPYLTRTAVKIDEFLCEARA
jgi:hypothetical protein